MANLKSVPPLLLLSRDQIAGLVTLDECIEAIEGAFAAHARGDSFAPRMMHLHAKGGEFHIKAGGLAIGHAYVASKINGSFFDNPKLHELPSIVGLILLSDAATGVPLAILESGFLTALRTGAATAVAAKYLARPESRVATVCGAGRQGEIQLRALAKVLPLEQVYVWSWREPADAFAARLEAALEITVRATTDLQRATNSSDVIVTCTPAKSWFIGADQVRPGTFISAVGSDSPDKQELEPHLVASAKTVCDLRDQCTLVGEIHHAIEAGLVDTPQRLAELGEVIIGKASGREYPGETTIFDSTGTALQDCAAAILAYTKAVIMGVGSTISLHES